MLYLVITALCAVALLVALPLLRRDKALEEVDRFRHVRSLTTSWAGETTPDEADGPE